MEKVGWEGRPSALYFPLASEVGSLILYKCQNGDSERLPASLLDGHLLLHVKRDRLPNYTL
jgi:hypothetical protein